MKKRSAKIDRPVTVIQNTTKNKADYMEIRDAKTGKKLHRGQPKYIEKVLATEFNHVIENAV